MKKIGVISLLFVLLFLVSCMPETPEVKEVVIYEFYGKSCPHCKKMNTWLEEIKPKYPSLTVVQHEVYSNKDNQKLFQDITDAYGKIRGGAVPTIFIGDKRIRGFSAELGEKIEAEIQNCLKIGCPSPADKLK
ncbi:thioredoxin family protein [Candidatus Woesearchaeota archaeon]|nr:thioredoxin family protein [Candidatus Woesearchaeota archaeon]